MTNFTWPPTSIGWVLALIGLILVIVLWVVGQLDAPIAGLFGLGFLARLL